ncbi:MAG: 16S rRNA (guanine(527)-N(7))-methyltransferase RsmG, partial [Spirochaetaceae bacterium]|nr:16S rRNA (guanine(527)-N(7))-methyltransferase RsmG [Spirochaetaceae bacterium]
ERLERLLNKYIEEIELFNPAWGLVGAADRRELVVKHLLDSLAPLGLLRGFLERPGAGGAPPALADVGSGAGLPGIPLAIALPECPVALIERKGRRAAFLRNTQAVLGLPNLTVEEGPMEHAPPLRFRLVVFRAFRPLDPAILRGLFRLLEPGGVLAAYKGRRAVLEAELDALPGAPARDIFPIAVPFLDEERHLVVLRAPAKGGPRD